MIVESVEKVCPGPASLRDTGCLAVSEHILQVLWRKQLRFQSIYIPESVERGLREWLEDVPICLRQEILRRSYSSLFSSLGRDTEMCSSSVPIMLASVMETLYHPALHHLELWTDLHWHQEARLKVLHLLHSQDSQIKSLNFSCYKTPIFQFQALSYSERYLLMNVLNKFSQLRQLSLPYVADDDILSKLGGGCCPQLELLDVHGSWEVTNQGLAELSGQEGQMVIGRVGWQPSHFTQCSEGQKLLSSILKGSPVSASQIASFIKESRTSQTHSLTQSLTQLNIQSTATDWKGIQSVLQNFLKLRKLQADEPHWQELLVNLDCKGSACSECLPANLSVREVNLSHQTYSLLQPLARSLPNLEQLIFNNFERSEAYLDGIDNLPLLQSFPRLQSLTLHDVEMEQIYNYFKTYGGSNIKTFSYSSRHRTIDLYKLDSLCPNLQSLSVTGSFISYKPGMAAPEMIHSKTFSALKSLSLKDISMEGDQCCWKRLVKAVRCLVRLTLQNIRMTDADISELISANCLTNLEELNISANGPINLTEDSVFKLIKWCPRLTKIGGICCWSARDLVTLLEQLNNQHHFKLKMDERD